MPCLRARWLPFLLTATLLTAGCGSSGGDPAPTNPFGFDFDRSDYPQIVTLPLAALREDRPTTVGEQDGGVQAALFQRVFDDAITPKDTPFDADWDTLYGLYRNGQGDPRVATRFFLAYEVVENPTAGTCTVTIHLIEGLPYDPDRPALATYMGSAMVGEIDRDGDPIDILAQCSELAAHRAFDALHAAGHFDEGWSSGPPAHMQ